MLRNRASRPEVVRSVEERVQVSFRQLMRLNSGGEPAAIKTRKIHAMMSGNYLSRIRGRGMEFDEVRLYSPGDDMRSLDWKITARTGKPHTRLYREERERPVFLCVDYRASMFFATRGQFKSVVAAKLASILAWSGLRHSDRVGGQIFTGREVIEFRPRRGKQAVLHLLKHLAELSSSLRQQSVPANEPATESELLASALLRLQRHARPGSVIFLISDFRGFDEAAERMMMRLGRHCDLVLLMVYDPFERDLPVSGRYRISDGRQRMVVNAADRGSASRYAEIFRQRREHVLRVARQNRMRFLDFSTTAEPERILQLLAETPA